MKTPIYNLADVIERGRRFVFAADKSARVTIVFGDDAYWEFSTEEARHAIINLTQMVSREISIAETDAEIHRLKLTRS